MWSLSFYIKYVFKWAEFKKGRLNIINRNWIQHHCNLWSKIDTINLFCAVDALLLAKLPLEEVA